MSTIANKAALRFETKAVDAEKRTFEGLASTWNEDLGGDVIHQGAFKATLQDWKKAGRLIPLIDQHNYGSIRSVVGKMIAAKETDAGLEATFQVIEGPDGDEVLRRIKGGFVDGLSIGYEAVKWEIEKSDSSPWGAIRHLKEVKLFEVSVVIWGMNSEALIDESSVKTLLTHMDDAALRRLNTFIGNLRKKAAEIESPPAEQPPAAVVTDPPAPPAPVADPPSAAPDEAAPPKANDPEPAYLYAEALQQRLLGLKLHAVRTQGEA